VIIHSGSSLGIYGIQLEYSNGINSYLTSSIGSSSGEISTFNLTNDEYISSVYICYESNSKVISRLNFSTNLDKQSAVYGTDVIFNDLTTCSTLSLQGRLLGLGG